MRRMIADKEFTYRLRALKVGQPFDADDEHVQLFSTIGYAHVPSDQEYEANTLTSGQEYDTRVMVARKRGRPRKE